ncbi:hypothetical protein OA180_00085 [Candidatus Pelagibacter sp.]|nr:hypothetical protein [Candidatus Pelagibacter sp.]
MRDKISLGSNKSFGIVFSIFFSLIAIYVFYKFEKINYTLIFLSILFLVLGLRKSKILTPLNILWFKFGILLSKIVSPLIMVLIFFIVVTPLALLAKIVKKDFLELDKKKNKKKLSYWIEKEKYNNSMKDQF